MAAEGCEDMSGNGELEESAGSLMIRNEFSIKRFVFLQMLYGPCLISRHFE